MDARPHASARFVALDIRASSAHAAAVDAHGRVMLAPQAVPLADLAAWLGHELLPTDQVVLGAPANPWAFYDQVAALAGAATVAHPHTARLLPSFGASADPRDALLLARMHARGLVPALWAPEPAVRELRALSAQRRRLIQQHASASRGLARLIERCRLAPPAHDRLAAGDPGWWAGQPLCPADRVLAREHLAALNRAVALLRELDQRLEALSEQPEWHAQVERLTELPGMQRVCAMVVLGAIGQVARFAGAEQLVSYAGLAPGARAGGADGRQELRETMLDVAERAARESPEWRAHFAELEARLGQPRAITAAARKLTKQVWRTLAADAGLVALARGEAAPLRRAA